MTNCQWLELFASKQTVKHKRFHPFSHGSMTPGECMALFLQEGKTIRKAGFQLTQIGWRVIPVCADDRIDEKQIGSFADQSADQLIDLETIQAQQDAMTEMKSATGRRIERLCGLGIKCETSRLPILLGVLHVVQ